MKEITHSPLFFGKLPQFGDFIQHNAAGSLFQSYEQLIREGLYLCQSTGGQGWSAIYEHSSVFRFLFYPEETDTFLIGTMYPSFDKSRRKYPFTVAVQFEKNDTNNRMIRFAPVMFQEFFRNADCFYAKAIKEIGKNEIIKNVDSIHIPSPFSMGEFEESFNNFLHNTSLVFFFQTLFEDFENPDKYVLVKNIIDILTPLCHRDPTDMALGLRFPLGNNPEIKKFIFCFWTHFCLEYLKKPHIPCNLFWTHTHRPEETNKSYGYLFFRKPSSKIYKQLLQPELDNDNICKLEKEGREGIVKNLNNMQLELHSIVKDKDLTLHDLVDHYLKN